MDRSGNPSGLCRRLTLLEEQLKLAEQRRLHVEEALALRRQRRLATSQNLAGPIGGPPARAKRDGASGRDDEHDQEATGGS